jgi:hypothetical protein
MGGEDLADAAAEGQLGVGQPKQLHAVTRGDHVAYPTDDLDVVKITHRNHLSPPTEGALVGIILRRRV